MQVVAYIYWITLFAQAVGVIVGILLGGWLTWFAYRAIYIWWQDKRNGIKYE